jgi:hypothetical protein
MSLVLKTDKGLANKKKLLIDGDGIVHAAANAADGGGYNITGTSMRHHLKKDAVQWCKDQGMSTSLIEPVSFKPDPLSWATNSVDEMILSIFEELESEDYVIYVKGEGNYRYELFPDYKANRDGAHIPFHLKDCYKHIVDFWGAIECHGEEADDQLGIQQCRNNYVYHTMMLEDQHHGCKETVIVTRDKDLKCIPGWNYNWYKKELVHVSKKEALQNFYIQLITGDTSDNIPGLSEKAPKKRAYPTKPILAMTEEADMYLHCRKGYEKKYGDDWENNLLLNGRLLWIRQKEGEIWES